MGYEVQVLNPDNDSCRATCCVLNAEFGLLSVNALERNRRQQLSHTEGARGLAVPLRNVEPCQLCVMRNAETWIYTEMGKSKQTQARAASAKV